MDLVEEQGIIDECIDPPMDIILQTSVREVSTIHSFPQWVPVCYVAGPVAKKRSDGGSCRI